MDGGIHDETIDLVLDAGANVIVAGSAVFGTDIRGNYHRLTAHFTNSKGEER